MYYMHVTVHVVVHHDHKWGLHKPGHWLFSVFHHSQCTFSYSYGFTEFLFCKYSLLDPSSTLSFKLVLQVVAHIIKLACKVAQQLATCFLCNFCCHEFSFGPKLKCPHE